LYHGYKIPISPLFASGSFSREAHENFQALEITFFRAFRGSLKILTAAAFPGVNQILQGNTRTASGKFPQAGRGRKDVRAARPPVRQ
jgi:xanthine dehydrogenase molybdopterin-binding subunit B